MTHRSLYATEEPRVFMFDDGRHKASLYQMEPPLSPEDLVYNVDQLVDSGVDTLVYSAGLEGGVVLYDSRVAPKWGDNVTSWTHTVWYRAARNIRQLIADGYDPLKLLCDRSHEKGVWFIVANWVNFPGGDRETDGGLGRKSDFVYEHPEFQVGAERDPRSGSQYSWGSIPTRFSFLHPEVRNERFVVFREMLSRYETDGVLLNLIDYAPFCKFSEVGQLAPVLTQWVRDLRGVASEAERDQGRRKRIYVHIPSHPDAWAAVGYDVPTWVSDNLVDGLVCQSGLSHGPIDQDTDLSDAVDLVRDTDCRVLVALRGGGTAPLIWAAAANAYAQGADGIGFGGSSWSMSGWPWTGPEYQTLRLLGHPDMLATADKHYMVRQDVGGRPMGSDWAPGVAPSLPQTLVEGKPVEVQLRISDDLARWHALGRVESVLLQVHITSLEASLNEVLVHLNGEELPDSALRLKDVTYRQLRVGSTGPYGYKYEFRLAPEHFPKPGHNTVKVTLAKRDRNIALDFDVYDVACTVRYRIHRHFEREPVDY